MVCLLVRSGLALIVVNNFSTGGVLSRLTSQSRVGRVSLVHAKFVFSQVFHFVECLETVLALEQFGFSIMGALVLGQMRFSRKCLPAMSTLEWSLLGVNIFYVATEVRAFCE